MTQKPLAEVVRDNVNKLRESGIGRMGQRAFAEKCKIGEGTVWRIAQGQNSTTIGTLEAIAEAHGLKAWQLLVEGFDPHNPPVLAPLTDAEKRLYEAIKAAKVGQ